MDSAGPRAGRARHGLLVPAAAWLGLATLVLFPYVVYTFAPYVVPRNLDAAIPFACLLAAAAIVTAAERIPSDVLRRTAVVVVGCVIAAYCADLSSRLILSNRASPKLPRTFRLDPERRSVQTRSWSGTFPDHPQA